MYINLAVLTNEGRYKEGKKLLLEEGFFFLRPSGVPPGFDDRLGGESAPPKVKGGGPSHLSRV